jgi:hypothetical protein
MEMYGGLMWVAYPNFMKCLFILEAMTVIEAFFLEEGDEIAPFILGQEALAYECDGKEGSITFNGYYRVEDSALPLKHLVSIKIREKEPYSVVQHEVPEISEEEYKKQGYRVLSHEQSFYNTLEQYMYRVEVYKRVRNDPDNYHHITNQTIWFRVLSVV